MTEFRASRPSDRSALTGLWQQAFGDEPDFIDAFFASGYAPARSRVAEEKGEIAAMLYWFDCTLKGRKLAYIYAVATEQRFRGRGIASALMADTHAFLTEQGYAGAALSPGSEALFRFYGNMGYMTAGFRSEQTVLAGSPVPIREVEPEEYAVLRRRLLPENGIRQEGASLAFLGRFARFYAGADFVAAVSGEEASCLEFLGNNAEISGLLGALGLPEAVVRTPGREIPCAMVKWFTQAPTAEIYLGFPFD